MKIPHPLAILNIPCFEAAAAFCEVLLAETIIGIFLCIAAAKIACDSDTLAN
jgi:hypothetical protein